MNDRADELLRECGRTGYRLGLAFAWTDALRGEGAKACSRGGSAAWKRAKPLAGNEEAAIAFFVERARKRNPAVVLGASGLVGIEADGELDELGVRFEIPPLPDTATVQSRRGPHRYYRPPAGRTPMKVQLDTSGVVVSEDGYLVGAGALHPSGAVYTYVNDGAIAELPPAAYDRLVELGGDTRAETRRRFETGEPIPEGHRDLAIFWHAVELLRGDLGEREALNRLLELNTAQCRPPLDAKLVKKQLAGAVKWVRQHPSETEKARAEARRILAARRAGRAPAAARARPALWLPFSDVTLERSRAMGLAGEAARERRHPARGQAEARQEPALNLDRGPALTRAARGRVLRRADEDAPDRGRGSSRPDRQGQADRRRGGRVARRHPRFKTAKTANGFLGS